MKKFATIVEHNKNTYTVKLSASDDSDSIEVETELNSYESAIVQCVLCE